MGFSAFVFGASLKALPLDGPTLAPSQMERDSPAPPLHPRSPPSIHKLHPLAHFNPRRALPISPGGTLGTQGKNQPLSGAHSEEGIILSLLPDKETVAERGSHLPERTQLNASEARFTPHPRVSLLPSWWPSASPPARLRGSPGYGTCGSLWRRTGGSHQTKSSSDQHRPSRSPVKRRPEV